jgi:hypothetical protein
MSLESIYLNFLDIHRFIDTDVCQYQVKILGASVYLVKGYLKYLPLISLRMTRSLIGQVV